MSVEQIIGYLGAFTISLLQIPQVYKCYQTKSAKDLFICTAMFGFLVGFRG